MRGHKERGVPYLGKAGVERSQRPRHDCDTRTRGEKAERLLLAHITWEHSPPLKNRPSNMWYCTSWRTFPKFWRSDLLIGRSYINLNVFLVVIGPNQIVHVASTPALSLIQYTSCCNGDWTNRLFEWSYTRQMRQKKRYFDTLIKHDLYAPYVLSACR